MLQYIQQVVPRYFAQPPGQYDFYGKTYNSGGRIYPTSIVIDRPSDDPQDLYIQTLVRDLTHEASTEFSKLPAPPS